MRTKNLRIQDIVARTSGVSLRNTVRVLRALCVVSAAEDEHGVHDSLLRILQESAQHDGDSSPLNERPGFINTEATESSYERMLEKMFDGKYHHLNKVIDSDAVETGQWQQG